MKDFMWCERPVPTPREGEFLIRVVYLSLDPTNRFWMNLAAVFHSVDKRLESIHPLFRETTAQFLFPAMCLPEAYSTLKSDYG